MDLYQIWTAHNRPWSMREIVLFLIILSVCSFFSIRAAHRHQIKIYQALASLALLVYLGVVFASTVFTRMPTVRQYELIPFWSWYEVFIKHSRSLLVENLLNILLLLPAGVLLPIIFARRLRPSVAFMIGALISAVIEVSQLILRRGLFEWDDMFHNGLGCMLGCLIVNAVMERVKRMKGLKKMKKREKHGGHS
mgnify:FL=1